MAIIKGGSKAPVFSLPTQDGKKASLGDFKGRWVVLYFYPKDNTPGCTIEAKDFTALAGKFEKLGAVVLGVSPDGVASHCKFIEKQGLKITLLSDSEKDAAKKYGAWGMKTSFGKTGEGLIRSTFLISPDGKIAKAWNGVKAKGHAEAVLEVFRSLRSA
ncbi:MAG: thioredoxin-dependent thiol peroxidase [Nitrospinae bacterium]|nr:thioredoxin-dependent thiol peroxidase [Nitrospinota bacterium]